MKSPVKSPIKSSMKSWGKLPIGSPIGISVNYLFIAVSFVMLAQSSMLFAGGGSSGVGGGGLGYVCRNQDGKIMKAELLDLVELESRNIALISEYSNDNSIISRISSAEIRKIVLDEYFHVQSRQVFTNKKFSLPDPKDYTPLTILKGCSLEVIGLYNDEKDELRVDREILDNLSAVNRRAFYFHEAFYRLARRISDAWTSDQIRPIVGNLFGGNPDLAQLNRAPLFAKLRPTECHIYVSSLRIEGNHYVFTLNSDMDPGSNFKMDGILLEVSHDGVTSLTNLHREKMDNGGFEISVPVVIESRSPQVGVAFVLTTPTEEYWLPNGGSMVKNSISIDPSLQYLVEGYSGHFSDHVIRLDIMDARAPKALTRLNPSHCGCKTD